MKRILSGCFLLLSCIVVNAQQSLIKESLKVNSKALGKEVEFSIYLPAGYEQTNRSYPALYLLHGYSDDETGWTQFGEVQYIADKSISTGETSPMVIIMPDAGVSWYLDSYDGKTRFEEFFIKELIPHIEANYRVRAKKEFRAVAGLSMGGFGTLLYATKHPDMFAAACPLSGAVWTDEEVENMPESRWNGYMSDLFGKGLKGKDRLNAHWKNNSILNIIQTGDVDKLKQVRFYIDCGDDDFLIKGNMALHAAMIDKGIPHEFRVRDGGHTWEYWRTALPEVLKFVGKSFHR